MEGTWELRSYRSEDYDAVLALWTACGLPARPAGRDTRDHIDGEVSSGTAFLLEAWDGADLVGAVLGTHDGRKGWINRLAVAPAHRRRGLGRVLVAEAERRLSEAGLEVIACLIESGNLVSRAVFHRLGYADDSGIVYMSKRKDPQS